jgi:UDP-N-acetylmuramoylalanine--D-glutamate ligase
MADFSVRGREVVVVGAARSGVAAAELARRRGATVTLTETRPVCDQADRLQAAGVRLELGGHQPSTLAQADLIVVSPGVPVDQPIFDGPRARGVEVIGELEFASRWLRGRVIAITGTKGKSTTTTLIGRMLEASGRHTLVGGNIGTPVASQVDASTPDTVHVIEVSSFQLETTRTFHPWIAVWLNITDDHLDRHATFDEYLAAKTRIFLNQGHDDWAVVNADDARVMAAARTTRAGTVTFALERELRDGVVVERDWIVRRTATGTTPLVPVSAVELTGRHMLVNVLAATTASHLAGVDPDAMRRALSGFHGLPHVMEPVAEVDGVRFVNDSKATNVDAAARSIESFAGGVVAIVGGRYKGGDFGQLAGPLAGRGRGVVAIGEASSRVREALSGVVPVAEASSMADAVRRAWDMARPDGVVLLAPACSSFDWFRDYADRGAAFKQEVLRLTHP